MSEQQLTPPVQDRDHVEGPASAPVTLVEYGDFQCPYCGDAAADVKQIQQQLGDQLRFAFRNFPLVESHPHALQAAEAAEAAGAQGKFWEMHDTLYAHQGALDRGHLVGYAQDLGLDVDRFERDLDEHTELGHIREDLESGEQSGVPGTPAFYINGEFHQGSFDRESLLRALRQRIGE